MDILKTGQPKVPKLVLFKSVSVKVLETSASYKLYVVVVLLCNNVSNIIHRYGYLLEFSHYQLFNMDYIPNVCDHIFTKKDVFSLMLGIVCFVLFTVLKHWYCNTNKSKSSVTS